MSETNVNPPCSGCGFEFDDSMCWCGIPREFHGQETGHGFVPLGCHCGFPGHLEVQRMVSVDK